MCDCKESAETKYIILQIATHLDMMAHTSAFCKLNLLAISSLFFLKTRQVH